MAIQKAFSCECMGFDGIAHRPLVDFSASS